MDVGLATSGQLQAFGEQDSKKGFGPCYTWWMSAPLQPGWLETVDTTEHHAAWISDPCTVPPDQRSGDLWEIPRC